MSKMGKAMNKIEALHATYGCAFKRSFMLLLLLQLLRRRAQPEHITRKDTETRPRPTPRGPSTQTLRYQLCVIFGRAQRDMLDAGLPHQSQSVGGPPVEMDATLDGTGGAAPNQHLSCPSKSQCRNSIRIKYDESASNTASMAPWSPYLDRNGSTWSGGESER